MARELHDWNAIQQFHDEGHGYVECARKFGFCHTAWTKAISRNRLRTKQTPFADRRRRYRWSDVQAYYDAGHSYRETAVEFGFCPEAWYNAVKRGEIKRKPSGMPIGDLLGKHARNRSNLKMRLLKAGLLVSRCQSCGITGWRGKLLTIHLDHINGDKNDNRLENLRMLCPNCHSQTPTFSGRNVRRPASELK